MFRAACATAHSMSQDSSKEANGTRHHSKRSRAEDSSRALGAGAPKSRKSANMGPTLLTVRRNGVSPSKNLAGPTLTCKTVSIFEPAVGNVKPRALQTQLFAGRAIAGQKLGGTGTTAMLMRGGTRSSAVVVTKIFRKPDLRPVTNTMLTQQQSTLTSFKRRETEQRNIFDQSDTQQQDCSVEDNKNHQLSEASEKNANGQMAVTASDLPSSDSSNASALFVLSKSPDSTSEDNDVNMAEEKSKCPTVDANGPPYAQDEVDPSAYKQEPTLLTAPRLLPITPAPFEFPGSLKDKQCVSATMCQLNNTSTTRGSTRPSTFDLTTKPMRRRTSVMDDDDDETTSQESPPIDDPKFFDTILSSDRAILTATTSKTSLACDIAAYGHLWLLHHRQREELYQPWQLTLTGKIEKLRLGVTAMYWESAKAHPVSPATVHVAISNFSRLLNAWTPEELEHPSAAQWALTAVVAYRLAFKFEERPEVLWEVNNFWDIFPMFTDWAIDRSDANMNKVEMAALHVLNDAMDIPLSPMFLSLYLSAGGWPENVAKDYRDLAMYILGLVTFTSTRDHLLKNIVPSKMAVAALVLAIKIVNGDRASPSGVLPHLASCPRTLPNNTDRSSCTCRYEFFPDRLKVYCNMELSELQPIIRGLSILLRSKPEETCVLKHFFPVWGEHDWQ